MYLEELYNSLKRPLKIFVNDVDLWDDFKENQIQQYCQFYVYVNTCFALHRFRNRNNVQVIKQMPTNQQYDGILINSDYIYTKLKEYNNGFNFVIVDSYLNLLNKDNIIDKIGMRFLIYKYNDINLSTDIKVIPEITSNIDHTIYLKEKIFIDKPKVFIVTPIYNQSEWTIKCIDSINKYAENQYDITQILVDNGSDKTNKQNLTNFLQTVQNIKTHFINFDKPIGFVKATNAGIKYALEQNADYICLQNNDTEVSQNWMSKLINALHGQIVVSNPVILQPEYIKIYNERLKNFPLHNSNITPNEASKILQNTYHNKIAEVFANKNEDNLTKPCFCCAMFNADIFKIYLLDECFGVGYADDSDYSNLLLNANLGFAHVLNCAITHYSQKTFSTVIEQNKMMNIQNARLYQADQINQLNKYKEKSTVVYTINLNKINEFTDFRYYDLQNCDYVYITLPQNINKISKYWKTVDITKLDAIFQNEVKTNEDAITYFQLHPALLFRNYKKVIYIDNNYTLDMFPYLFKNFAKNKNELTILGKFNLMILNLIKTNIKKLENIWKAYKENKDTLINLFKKNFENINQLSQKRFINNNHISLNNISIAVYIFNPQQASIITYYRELQPYSYLKYLGYNIIYFNNFETLNYSNINYLVLNRDFAFILQKKQQLKYMLLNNQNTYKFKIIYNLDDLLYDIPDYNPSRNLISSDKILLEKYFKNIFEFTNIIVLTTNYFKNSIINKFNINPQKIYSINNLISDDKIHHTNIIPHNFSNLIKIGIIANKTHITNSGKQDDFSIMYNWFKQNINKYQFYFFGQIPNELRNKPNCIFCGSSSFDQYEQLILNQHLDLIIACLADNEFNKCKSNLKLIQAYAFKIPIITNNIEPYKENKYKFNTVQEINNLINNICSSQEYYQQIINENYQYLKKHYLLNIGINKYIKMLQENYINV